MKRFDQYCPSLNVFRTAHKHGLCCGVAEMVELMDHMDRLGRQLPFFSTCPSCMINSSQIFCQLRCSPHKNKFITITQSSLHFVYEGHNPWGDMYIERSVEGGIEYDQRYVTELYESCKHVVWPKFEQPAVIIIGDPSTAEEFIERIGHWSNAPLRIDFKYINGTDQEQWPIIACNQSVGDVYPRLRHIYNTSCTPEDCPASRGSAMTTTPLPLALPSEPGRPWVINLNMRFEGKVYVSSNQTF